MPGFIEELRQRLTMPLPGETAQKKMWSELRIPELLSMPQNENTRLGGVLILLYPFKRSLYSVLILRTEGPDIHGGQIALPGGKAERSDNTIVDTALREAHEEIGINTEDIDVLGKLSNLYIPPSNYLIHTVIGYCKHRPVFKRQPDEVQEIIEYPVLRSLKEENIKRKEFVVSEDFRFSAPYFDINGHVVWGATGMILREFAEILMEIKDSEK